jgi:AraC-like DNA-binding protein
VLTQAAEPALAGEDALAALLDEALGVPLPARSAPARHRDLTEGAKAALHARITAAPHLAELACSLGVSPFHLSRTFARVEGIPLRRPDGTPIRWIFTDIRVDLHLARRSLERWWQDVAPGGRVPLAPHHPLTQL